MTTAQALNLGYVVAERGKGRWYCAPAARDVELVRYGRRFDTEADALGEVEARVAYRLKIDVETLRVHLALVTA